MKTPQTLFLVWHDTSSRSWFVIGKLEFDGIKYKFAYVQQVQEAQKKGFKPLYSFPDLNRVYTSAYLFPVFSNRLMSRSRPDYTKFLKWLDVLDNTDSPLVILSRTGGTRETDDLSVFPCPELNEEDKYKLYFFAHGLCYLPESAIERINSLKSGEKLILSHEFQNKYDSKALTLNTDESSQGRILSTVFM